MRRARARSTSGGAVVFLLRTLAGGIDSERQKVRQLGEARRQAAGRSAKLQEFLKQHPICCFCGGLTLAETFDHVPARSIFSRRHWPESYEFPACQRCNRATSGDEEFISLLARVASSKEDALPGDFETFKILLRSMRDRRPELLFEMRVDSRRARKAMMARNLELPTGTMYRDLPILAVNGPLVSAAVRSFARKLGLALYYKHAGTPLPSVGALWSRWWTNWSVQSDPIPPEVFKVAPEAPGLIRNQVDLTDQFAYRWGPPVEDPPKMVFLSVFRRSFAILVFVGRDPAEFAPIPENELMRPFDHSSPP